MKISKSRPKVRRLLSVYDKKTEKHVRDYELITFKLKEIQKLFNQSSNDPMYYCYRITEKVAPYFRKKYGRHFHFRKREYFLETRES